MLQALVTLAVEAAEEEPDQTLFYLLGGALAVWAVVVSFVGLRSADSLSSSGARAGVMAITTVLVVLAMASAVITA
jgi:membrane associated rhomboid family serine protease